MPEPELGLDIIEHLLYRMLLVTGETFPDEQLHCGLNSRKYFDENGETHDLVCTFISFLCLTYDGYFQRQHEEERRYRYRRASTAPDYNQFVQ